MQIRFISSRSQTMVTLADDDRSDRTLLSVARAHGIPILFNCECGDCGACLVEVCSLAGENRSVPPLTEKERFLLTAMACARAVKDGEAVDGEDGSASGCRYRLACQCGVGGDDIEVRYVSGIGSR